MATSTSARLRRLNEDILPTVASNLGAKFVNFTTDQSAAGEAQFASTVLFIVASFQRDDGISFEQSLLVKFNMPNEAVRMWLKLDFQFRNEVVVYETVLPFLNQDGLITKELFPYYYYGRALPTDSPDDYVIVLEDLRPAGFRLSPEFLDLDYDHCALAFRKLGIFHALSFVAKKLNPTKFYEVVHSLVETKTFGEHTEEDDNYLFYGSVERAAEPLLRRNEKVKEINMFKDKLKNTGSYFKYLFEAKEPMSVIVHGDFCRNNVLYKYEGDLPTDIRFFDLATARYGSPMLDFTFFFFLNCSEESRKAYREVYLKLYYDSLCSYVSEKEVPIPSLEDFREEFRQKAVYGFLICAFFKPAMMDPVPFDPVTEVRQTPKERSVRTLKNGGEKATEVTANMLREIIDLGCVL